MSDAREKQLFEASRGLAIMIQANKVLERAMCAYATDPSTFADILGLLRTAEIKVGGYVVIDDDDDNGGAPRCPAGWGFDGSNCVPME